MSLTLHHDFYVHTADIMPLFQGGAHCQCRERQFRVLSNRRKKKKWMLPVLCSKNLVLHSRQVKGTKVEMLVQLWDNYHQVSKHDSDLAKCMQFGEIDKSDILLQEARRQFVSLMQLRVRSVTFKSCFFVNYSIKKGLLRGVRLMFLSTITLDKCILA